MILSDLEMKVGHMEEKGRRMRGEDQNLIEAVASVFLLPGSEERISKVSPSIGILWVSLQNPSEYRDGLLDVLFFSSCQLIPRAPHQRRDVTEKDLAKNTANLFIVRPQRLR